MIRILLIGLFIAAYQIIYAQDTLLAGLDADMSQVENNRNLIIKEINLSETDSQQTEGGRILRLFGEQDELVKIEEILGTSFGRIRTMVFLKKAIPFLIISKEEHHTFNGDRSGRDNDSMHQVFEIKMYIFNWEKEEGKIIRSGSSIYSDDVCTFGEFLPLITTSFCLWRGDK